MLILQSKWRQQLFVYLLSVTMLFALGMDLVADVQKVKTEDAEFTDFNTNLVEEPVPEHHVIKPKRTNLPEPSLTLVEMPVANYEVTAYFLNVRSDKNATSPILDVVENGDILEVIEFTNKSWLRLKSGGYVNGKYTELINKNVKQAKRVHILSAGHEITQNLTVSQPSTAIKSESGLSEEHIAQIFEGSPLANKDLEKAILDIEQEYGINAYFTIAVMKLESGHGKSKIAKDKNNLFGLNAIDGDAYNKAYSFKTKGDSVRKFGQIISENYVDKGYTSIKEVGGKYCKANPKWPSLVMKIMENDYNKLL